MDSETILKLQDAWNQSNLAVLDLEGNLIDDSALRSFDKNQTLRLLSLRNTKVTPEGVAELEQSHPQLVVILQDKDVEEKGNPSSQYHANTRSLAVSYLRGFDHGYEKAYPIGKKIGYKEGYDSGNDDGLMTGFVIGRITSHRSNH